MKKITVLLAEDHTIVREGFHKMLELEEDLEVVEETPVVSVVAIQLNAFGVGGLAAAGHLPQAGDAGLYEAVVGEVGAVLFDFGGDDGAWADEAHAAGEDVPELGEFIERSTAEEVADAGNAGIVLELMCLTPLGAGFRVSGEIIFEDLAGVDGHGAELPHGEEGTVTADAAMGEEDGAWGTETHGCCDGGEKNQEDGRANDNEEDVEGALDDAIAEEAARAIVKTAASRWRGIGDGTAGGLKDLAADSGRIRLGRLHIFCHTGP